jgi:hypothetical protein
MNTDKQRIAIAEACGWKCPCGFKEAFACWVRPSAMEHQTEWLPDYLVDLNAMHEAEKVLTPKYQPAKGESQWSDYLAWLGFCGENKTREVYECVTATAAQRAEAFLRTLGKWEEDK